VEAANGPQAMQLISEADERELLKMIVTVPGSQAWKKNQFALLAGVMHP
jgi:hypothetical protein